MKKPVFGSAGWFAAQEMPLGSLAGSICPGRILRLAPPDVDIDFQSERPLKSRPNSDLVALAEAGLSRPWPALELPTLAYEEAKSRKPRVLKTIWDAFRDHHRQPIPWLCGARATLVAADLRPGPPRATSSVYFVLVGGFTEMNEHYGVYVGSTSTVDESLDNQQAARIAQHFSGVRASAAVKGRGIEPLWSLNALARRIRRTDRRFVEDAAHRALEAVVPKVLGDVSDGGQD